MSQEITMKREIQITFDNLYENCLYSSIAHAIGNVKYPFLAYEQAWDGQVYCFHFDGVKGAIAFDLEKRIMAGAATDDKSSRWNWYPRFKAIHLFDSACREVRSLADDRTLQYLVEEVGGVSMPVATIAFWTERNRTVTSDNWEDFRRNGGQFISEIVCSMEELRDYWGQEESLSAEERKLLDHLFRMKRESYLELSREDVTIFDTKTKGYREFLISLSEIGFEVGKIMNVC